MPDKIETSLLLCSSILKVLYPLRKRIKHYTQGKEKGKEEDLLYASRKKKSLALTRLFQRGGVPSSYTLECNNSINLINSASGELPTISHQLWMKLLKLQKGGWREEKTRWQHTSHSTYKAKKVNWLCKIALFLVCMCVLYSAMLLLQRRSRPSIIHVW